MGSNDVFNVDTTKIQVFRPTLDQMDDFSEYIKYIESRNANKAGLAKIIPPPEWCPRKNGYDDIDLMVIESPIMQIIRGREGLYTQYNIQKKSLTVKEFEKQANSSKFRTPDFFDYDDLERKYWRNITYAPPIYGADVSGSLYDEDVDRFNISRLDTILDMVNNSYGIKIMGVNTPYLYFGMWKSTFPWHTEDCDLYSINYLHYGAPKSWYCVPPEHGRRLERLANGFFPNIKKGCPAFLRHKTTLISPQVLKKYSIPYNKITQEPGEFMITFPYAYHAGYNHGYNCAESTNFAMPRWVEYGKRAVRCYCREDAVKISMEVFVKKFQPERYDLWLHGKDVGPHPEDPSHVSAAPAPMDRELAVFSKVGKSKRNPTHESQKESNSSYEDHETNCSIDSNIENVCSDISPSILPPQTKAAVKAFDNSKELEENSCSWESQKPYEDCEYNAALKKDKSRPSSSKKRKCKMEENLNSTPKHIYCTRPVSHPLNIHTVSMSPVNINVSRFLEELLESDNSNCTRQQNNQSTQRDVKDQKLNLTPPPLQQISYSNIYQGPQTSLTGNIKQEILPPPPPLLEQYTPHCQVGSSRNFNYEGNESLHHEMPLLEDMNSSKRMDIRVSSEYVCPKLDVKPTFIRNESLMANTMPDISTSNSAYSTLTQSLVVPMKKENVNYKTEVCTSTEDLLTNELIVNSIAVQSSVSDMEKIVTKGYQNAQEKELIKLMPIPQYMYQFLPYHAFGEAMYNKAVSSMSPHCAICLLLKKYEIPKNLLETKAQIPQTSQVLVPNIAFTAKTSEGNQVLDDIGKCRLVVCSNCNVCVHSSCYGVFDDKLDEPWKCDKCKQNVTAMCYLCPLRGGPLKQIKKPQNKWAHITCALLMPGLQFTNGIHKNCIELGKLIEQRSNSKLKCIFCCKSNQRLKALSDYIQGYCVQCFCCFAPFHVSCGHVQGCTFEKSDWPDPIIVTCKKCIKSTQKKREALLSRSVPTPDIEVGTAVLAKNTNTRYYEATVKEKSDIMYHDVHFIEDNSTCDRIRASDIKSHKMDTNPPEIGDKIKVFFEKKMQHAIYAGSKAFTVYTVEFADFSTVKRERHQLYLQSDPLPKKVTNKLSTATPQTKDIFSSVK